MIRIGPAGWAYKDWEGIVYPKPKPRGFDPVAYLARHIDAIEINSSYGSPAGTGPGLGRARWRQSALPLHGQAAPGLHARPQGHPAG